jgi:hypothetical protein
MSKTNFVDGDPSRGIFGTVVTADFLNALNKHHHTGLDQDGHGALPYAADTGTANAYVVTLNPALTQYVTGMPIYFQAANTSTGPSTININSLGFKTIKKNGASDLVSGDIQSGQIVAVVYDGAYMQLIGPDGGARLDANGRVVHDANTIWDGTAGRSASPATAANTVPVRRSSSPYAVPDAELAMTGEANNSSTTSPVTLDLGSVTAGDRIYVESMGNWTLSGSLTNSFSISYYGYVSQNSGTAAITDEFGNVNLVGQTSLFYGTGVYVPGTPFTYYIRCGGVLKVTASGTLVLKAGYAGGAALGASITNTLNNFKIAAFFLKKQ